MLIKEIKCYIYNVEDKTQRIRIYLMCFGVCMILFALTIPLFLGLIFLYLAYKNWLDYRKAYDIVLFSDKIVLRAISGETSQIMWADIKDIRKIHAGQEFNDPKTGEIINEKLILELILHNGVTRIDLEGVGGLIKLEKEIAEEIFAIWRKSKSS